jgi:hypothetical protein
MKGTPNMKRTFALTVALALASLGVSAYAQTPPTDPGSSQTQSAKKHKKQKAEKKEKKAKKAKATPAADNK